jgi:hypothetical protein
MGSPVGKKHNQAERKKEDEGIYKGTEGKNLEYADRLADQDEIKIFL